MTHGDKAKAKKGKSSQASAKKTSSKTVEGGKNGSKAAVKAGKGDKTGAKKQQGSPSTSLRAGPSTSLRAAPEKGAATGKKGSTGPIAKESAAAGGDAKAKSRGTADATPGFSNAIVAAAFKRAVKKYPNAFRKLTD